MDLLLDTVTISELRKAGRMDPAVQSWQSHRKQKVYLSVITMNQIRFGIGRIEKQDPAFAVLLERWYGSIVSNPGMFALLDVNLPIAEVAADFRRSLKLSYNDSFIAATAKVHDLTLATRNTSDFEKTGIELTNPWEHTL